MVRWRADVGAGVASGGVGTEEEDDGHVVVLVLDEAEGTSELVDFAIEVAATVALPCRVPYGFHGVFITEEPLAAQRST
ncbi:hypothetical protein E2562_010589 [Oryza meyeriana var. granulata]|uniref:Uncharacterized protein n=1 Tax=Oryza meyeriana var. granulata TaxID=110450 RepID=A0A6G1BUC8_9ORYZ|nr:hypothetical protein E2562_010589 [Oryza meyeriana var. granulata]